MILKKKKQIKNKRIFFDLKYYTGVLQIGIKKGKKERFEKQLRKAFSYAIKTVKYKPWTLLEKNYKILMPVLDVEIRKQRRKQVVIKKLITKRHQFFLAGSWIYKGSFVEKGVPFYKGFVSELKVIRKKQGNTYDKFINHMKLLYDVKPSQNSIRNSKIKKLRKLKVQKKKKNL